MKRHITAACGLALAAAFILSVGCNTKKSENNGNNDNGGDTLRHVTAGGIDLYWQPDSETLSVRVAATTTGWVAVGFDPTAGMQGANIIVGFVKDGALHIRDDYGSAQYAHAPDTSAGGATNVLPDSGIELAGRTEIRFRIPLNSLDARDRPLTPGTAYNVILACGEDGADEFDAYHKQRTLVNIRL